MEPVRLVGRQLNAFIMQETVQYSNVTHGAKRLVIIRFMIKNCSLSFPECMFKTLLPSLTITQSTCISELSATSFTLLVTQPFSTRLRCPSSNPLSQWSNDLRFVQTHRPCLEDVALTQRTRSNMTNSNNCPSSFLDQ
jgi:hypothetical protein